MKVAEGYFSKISDKNPGGEMEKADFVEIFHVAFPSRSTASQSLNPSKAGGVNIRL